MPHISAQVQQAGLTALFDVSFLILIFINVLKAGDLLLRPYQRRWIQDKVETLTLVLDCTHPLRLFQRVPSDLWEGLSLAVSFVVGSIYVIALVWLKPGFLYHFYGTSIGWWIFYAVSAFASVLYVIVFWLQRVFEWLLGDQPKFLSFVGRFAVLLVLSVAAYLGLALLHFLSWSVIPQWLGKEAPFRIEKQFWDFAFSIDCLTSIKITFVCAIGLPLAVGALVTVFGTFLLILSILVVTLRAIAWRIAEFDKGAWAAIVLSLTVVLAIIEIWLKFYR